MVVRQTKKKSTFIVYIVYLRSFVIQAATNRICFCQKIKLIIQMTMSIRKQNCPAIVMYHRKYSENRKRSSFIAKTPLMIKFHRIHSENDWNDRVSSKSVQKPSNRSRLIENTPENHQTDRDLSKIRPKTIEPIETYQKHAENHRKHYEYHRTDRLRNPFCSKNNCLP